MDDAAKLKLLEDTFELDEGALKADTVLAELGCWDSMNRLSLIAVIDEEFDKIVTGTELRAAQTVGDLLQIMNPA